MLLIREVFVAKPGQASKLAKLFKETWSSIKAKIMTDFVGNYNHVIMEYEVENMAAFEKMMSEYMTKKMPKAVKEKMSSYTDMYLTGRREIYRVWN